MRMLHFALPLAVLLPPMGGAAANSPLTEQDRQTFIEIHAPTAVHEMWRVGIPASITLGQAVLESGWGRASTAASTNNYFGIKCHESWTGEIFYAWDDEAQQSCFRVYPDVLQSFIDHSEFLKSNPRYEPLFRNAFGDYQAWAAGLKASGYATDAAYAEKLVQIIEENGLFVYDFAMPVTQRSLLSAPAQPEEAEETGTFGETPQAEETETFNETPQAEEMWEEEEGLPEGAPADGSEFETGSGQPVMSAPRYDLGSFGFLKNDRERPEDGGQPSGSGKNRPLVPLPNFGN